MIAGRKCTLEGPEKIAQIRDELSHSSSEKELKEWNETRSLINKTSFLSFFLFWLIKIRDASTNCGGLDLQDTQNILGKRSETGRWEEGSIKNLRCFSNAEFCPNSSNQKLRFAPNYESRKITTGNEKLKIIHEPKKWIFSWRTFEEHPVYVKSKKSCWVVAMMQKFAKRRELVVEFSISEPEKISGANFEFSFPQVSLIKQSSLNSTFW